MSARRHLSVSAALIALLVLAGCGDDGDGDSADDPVDETTQIDEPTDEGETDEPEPSGEAPDACSLITTDEVATVLSSVRPDDAGFEVTTESAVVGEGTSCVYTWTSDFAGSSFNVSVFPIELYFDPGLEKTPLPDIGDDAFEQADNYYAQVGDWMINIVNVQLTEEAQVELLEIAAGRL